MGIGESDHGGSNALAAVDMSKYFILLVHLLLDDGSITAWGDLDYSNVIVRWLVWWYPYQIFSNPGGSGYADIFSTYTHLLLSKRWIDHSWGFHKHGGCRADIT